LTGSPEEVALFLEPLESSRKEVIFLPQAGRNALVVLNLLQAGRGASSSGLTRKANEGHARRTAERIHEFLKRNGGRRKGREYSPIIIIFFHPFSFTNVPVLKQSNGHDCGTHVLCHAQHSLDHFYLYGSYEGLHPYKNPSSKQTKGTPINH
ncbi:Sentrin-specific protease 8, partial [Caligus rogercresseyi]